MRSNVKKWLRLPSHRKGDIEVSHLAIWILLIAFLILFIIFIVVIKNDTTDTVSNLCTKTGGLFGC